MTTTAELLPVTREEFDNIMSYQLDGREITILWFPKPSICEVIKFAHIETCYNHVKDGKFLSIDGDRFPRFFA